MTVLLYMNLHNGTCYPNRQMIEGMTHRRALHPVTGNLNKRKHLPNNTLQTNGPITKQMWRKEKRILNLSRLHFFFQKYGFINNCENNHRNKCFFFPRNN